MYIKQSLFKSNRMFVCTKRSHWYSSLYSESYRFFFRLSLGKGKKKEHMNYRVAVQLTKWFTWTHILSLHWPSRSSSPSCRIHLLVAKRLFNRNWYSIKAETLNFTFHFIFKEFYFKLPIVLMNYPTVKVEICV